MLFLGYFQKTKIGKEGSRKVIICERYTYDKSIAVTKTL